MRQALGGKPATIVSTIIGISIIATGVLWAITQSAYAAVAPGNVKVSVVVASGSANPSDFTIQIKKTSGRNSGSVSGSGNTISFNQLTPGSYTLTRTEGPSGYVSKWSGDCNASGVVIIVSNTTANCTLTNTPGPTGGSGGGSGGSGRTERPAPVRPAR